MTPTAPVPKGLTLLEIVCELLCSIETVGQIIVSHWVVLLSREIKWVGCQSLWVGCY